MGLELFLVEGESAGSAVERVCNHEFQSVLAMQGKPMNAWKASRTKVESNRLFQEIIQTIGAGIYDEFELRNCRFEKVILLFDPDADGIHGCSLMLWFFYRWMPDLLSSGRLFVANPPLCELVDPAHRRRAFPTHPRERDELLAEWKKNLPSDAQDRDAQDRIEHRPFRGLASLGQELLYTSCIGPQTRLIRCLRIQDAQASLKAFGLEDNPSAKP